MAPIASTCSDGSDIILHPVAMRLFLGLLDRLKIDDSIPLDNLRILLRESKFLSPLLILEKKLIIYICDILLRESIWKKLIERITCTCITREVSAIIFYDLIERASDKAGRYSSGWEGGRDIYSRQDKKILDIFVRCIKYSDRSTLFARLFFPASVLEKKNIENIAGHLAG